MAEPNTAASRRPVARKGDYGVPSVLQKTETQKGNLSEAESRTGVPQANGGRGRQDEQTTAAVLRVGGLRLRTDRRGLHGHRSARGAFHAYGAVDVRGSHPHGRLACRNRGFTAHLFYLLDQRVATWRRRSVASPERYSRSADTRYRSLGRRHRGGVSLDDRIHTVNQRRARRRYTSAGATPGFSSAVAVRLRQLVRCGLSQCAHVVFPCDEPPAPLQGHCRRGAQGQAGVGLAIMRSCSAHWAACTRAFLQISKGILNLLGGNAPYGA